MTPIFWLSSARTDTLLLGLPLHVALPLALASAGFWLLPQGWSRLARALHGLAALLAGLQLVLLSMILILSLTLRLLGNNPSLIVEPLVYVFAGIGWLSILSAPAWCRRLLTWTSARTPGARPTIAAAAWALITSEFVLLWPAYPAAFIYQLFFKSYSATTAEPVLYLMAALVLVPVIGFVVWNSATRDVPGTWASIEALAPLQARVGVSGLGLRWGLMLSARVVLLMVAVCSWFITFTVVNPAGPLPLVVSAVAAYVALRLPFTPASVERGSVEFCALQAVRHGFYAGLLCLLFTLGVTVVSPSVPVLSWATDYVRPLLSTDEMLAERYSHKVFVAGGGRPHVSFRALSPQGACLDELRRRGSSIVPGVARALSAQQLRLHGKDSDETYATEELLWLLRRGREEGAHKDVLREYAADEGLNSRLREVARDVQLCFDGRGASKPWLGCNASSRLSR